MTATLATLDDLTTLYPITDAQQTQAVNLLIRASQLLRAAAPHTDARIANGTLDPVVVATVVAGIVARFLTNPEGAAAKTMTAGPFSQSVTFASRASLSSSTDATGKLLVTKDDLAQIQPYQPASRIGSIKVGAALAPRFARLGDSIVQDGLQGYPDRGLPGQIGPAPFVVPAEGDQ